MRTTAVPDGTRQLKAWWENCLSGTETIGLPWAVSLGFIRLITNPRIFERPLAVEAAIRRVRS